MSELDCVAAAAPAVSQPCGAGTFLDPVGGGCVNCSAGTYNPVAGGVGPSVCAHCPPGTWPLCVSLVCASVVCCFVCEHVCSFWCPLPRNVYFGFCGGWVCLVAVCVCVCVGV